jgi:HNH endonuclease
MGWINQTKAAKLIQAQLKELLHYDPDTGTFTRLCARGVAKAGDKTNGVNGGRCIVFRVAGRRWPAHRLAWLYIYGEWPRGDLAPKDGNACNLRIDNFELKKDKLRRLRNMRKAQTSITQEQLRALLCYDPVSGEFTRRTQQGMARVGMPVGRKYHANGCVYISVCGGRWPAQQLAWLYFHGVWPDREVIFKDGVRHNVSIWNLALLADDATCHA